MRASPVSLFLPLLAVGFSAAVGQPIDARDELIFLVNPPRKAAPNRGAANLLARSLQMPWTISADEPDANPQLKISGADLAEDASGNRELSVSVSHLGSTEFEPFDVRVIVYFFEREENGRVELSSSKIVSQWTSPPIDWKDAGSEKLVLRYPGPAGDSDRQYAGWVVSVSLENRLQDARGSSPEFLARLATSPRQLAHQGLPRTPSAAPDGSDRFLLAYKDFQAAERAFFRGNLVEAKKAVNEVISGLSSLQKENPGWQSRVVAYRLKSAQTLLAAIEAE